MEQDHARTPDFSRTWMLLKVVVVSFDLCFYSLQTGACAVGTNVGDIGIWEVGSREKLAQRTFKVWDITAASMPMQVSIYTPGGLFTVFAPILVSIFW